MNDEKETIITEENENHENDDMIADTVISDETISFKPGEEAAIHTALFCFFVQVC